MTHLWFRATGLHSNVADHAEFDSTSPFWFVRCHVWWGSCQLWIFFLPVGWRLSVSFCPGEMEMPEALSPPLCVPPSRPIMRVCSQIFQRARPPEPLVPDGVSSWSGVTCSLSNYILIFNGGDRTRHGVALSELVTCYPEQANDLMSLQTVIL